MRPYISLLLILTVGSRIGARAVPFYPFHLNGSDPIYPDFESRATTVTHGAFKRDPSFYKEIDIASAKVYSFHTGRMWNLDPVIKNNPKAKAVMRKMHKTGMFNAIVMPEAKMSIIGANKGPTKVPDFMKEGLKKSQDYIIMNGGFFVMPTMPQNVAMLQLDIGTPTLTDKQVQSMGYYTVGESSISPYHVAIPKQDGPFYQKLVGDDESFLWSAPHFKEPLPLSKAPQLQYFNPKGWRTEYSKTPGGLATANQPNERLALVIMPDKTRIIFAYLSKRELGMDMNDLRTLIDVFLQQYLGKGITEATQALNLDGGGSIFVGWFHQGRMELLASGGMGGMPSLPWDPPSGEVFRDVSTLVKFEVQGCESEEVMKGCFRLCAAGC